MDRRIFLSLFVALLFFLFFLRRQTKNIPNFQKINSLYAFFSKYSLNCRRDDILVPIISIYKNSNLPWSIGFFSLVQLFLRNVAMNRVCRS